MVRLALIGVVLSTLSLYAAPYWIQVSSVRADKNIAPSFIMKIKKSGFTYKIVEEQGRKKVRLGSFSQYKEALKTLPKVRCKIAYDAFIVPHTLKKPRVRVIKPTLLKDNPVVVKTTTSQGMPPVVVTVAPEPCECIYDVHLLRKMELENALTYYKHASYYEFNTTE